MIKDESLLKFTTENVILTTFLVIPSVLMEILRYDMGNSSYIHSHCKKVSMKFQAVFSIFLSF